LWPSPERARIQTQRAFIRRDRHLTPSAARPCLAQDLRICHQRGREVALEQTHELRIDNNAARRGRVAFNASRMASSLGVSGQCLSAVAGLLEVARSTRPSIRPCGRNTPRGLGHIEARTTGLIVGGDRHQVGARLYCGRQFFQSGMQPPHGRFIPFAGSVGLFSPQ